MTRDANDIARDYAREPEKYHEATKPAPRRGRVIGVFSPNEHEVLSAIGEPGEDLISESATFKVLGNDAALVEDEDHTFLLNLRAYRYIEFWVRDEDGEG